MNVARRNLATGLLISFLIFASSLWAQTNGDPPDRVARLSYMNGSVSFEPSGETDWAQASLNYPVTSGDRLWTDKDARAELETGNIAVRMDQQTDLTATQINDQMMQLGLAQGTIRVRAFDVRQGNSIEIDTPSVAITIAQAGDYRVDVYPDQNTVLLSVNSGEVSVSGTGIDQVVPAGAALKIVGNNPPQLVNASLPGRDSFDQWCSQRDALYARAQTQQYVSPYTPGYYELDQYGSWASVPQYGPIWYPTTVAVGWVPYRFGRWAWVEPWGWTWVDVAPWGFAPFHYGRWVQVGPRWGWLPGPVVGVPVYGPAFVGFIGGAGFSVGFGVGGVAAWFPLGPGEPFYPWYHHNDAYFRQINVTNVRNINITNINVTNVNNIHYRYQTTAVTAVPANAFRSSQLVNQHLARVDAAQLAHAQVIPHPAINPEPRAFVGGAATTRPPVSAQRPMTVQHAPVTRANQTSTAARNIAPTPPQTNEAQRGNQVPRPPTVSQPQENAARTPPPNTTNRPPVNQAVNQPGRAGQPPNNRPTLVSKAPPPIDKLPYSQKEPAMQEHPGRPLEPQQRANLHQGQPAGPMQDREFPPHAQPMPSHGGQQGHSSGSGKPH